MGEKEDKRGLCEKMPSMRDQIEETLQAAFSPSELSVQDVSESHRGHAGFQEGLSLIHI